MGNVQRFAEQTTDLYQSELKEYQQTNLLNIIYIYIYILNIKYIYIWSYIDATSFGVNVYITSIFFGIVNENLVKSKFTGRIVPNIKCVLSSFIPQSEP